MLSIVSMGVADTIRKIEPFKYPDNIIFQILGSKGDPGDPFEYFNHFQIFGGDR